MLQQAIKQKNNKIMSFLYNKQPAETEVHKGASERIQRESPSFLSKGIRFEEKKDRSPGPGSYNYASKNFQNPQYHVPREVTESTSVNRQHLWIYGNERGSFVPDAKYSLGPGSYELDRRSKNQKASWSKTARFDYKNNQSLVGPGSYEQEAKQKKKPFSSVFKSKSPKSYFSKYFDKSGDQIQKNDKSDSIYITQREQNPEDFNSSASKGKQKKKSSVFASQIPRFRDQRDDSLGPGYYDLDATAKPRQKLPRIVAVRNEPKVKQKPGKKTLPGPGSYEANSKTIQKEIEHKGNYMSGKDERFHYEKSMNMQPGPGHYMQNKYIFMNDSKQKQGGDHASFNTSSPRSNLELPNKNTPFGSYNVEIFDMQYRVKKKQEHLEKLKIMEVSLPAFETKARK